MDFTKVQEMGRALEDWGARRSTSLRHVPPARRFVLGARSLPLLRDCHASPRYLTLEHGYDIFCNRPGDRRLMKRRRG